MKSSTEPSEASCSSREPRHAMYYSTKASKSLQWEELCVPLALAPCQSVFSSSLVAASQPASHAALTLMVMVA